MRYHRKEAVGRATGRAVSCSRPQLYCYVSQNVKTATPFWANRNAGAAHSHPVPEQFFSKTETYVCAYVCIKKQKYILKVNTGDIFVEQLYVLSVGVQGK